MLSVEDACEDYCRHPVPNSCEDAALGFVVHGWLPVAALVGESREVPLLFCGWLIGSVPVVPVAPLLILECFDALVLVHCLLPEGSQVVAEDNEAEKTENDLGLDVHR